MALIVEDGTGLAGANTYVSEADFLDYMVAQGLAIGAGDPSASLLRATAWIDGRYRSRFPGSRTHGRDQSLEWPRMNAYDAAGYLLPDDEVPREIVVATMEAAQRELSTAGSLYPDVAAGARIKRKWMSGMGIEYADSGASSAPGFPVIDGILAGLIGTGASGTATRIVVRA